MKTVNQYLEELYTADPSLKEHEEELKKVLQTMLKNKPDITLDAAFVSSLKRRLQAQAESMSEASLEKGGWLGKLVFALSGAAVTAVAFIAVSHLAPFGNEALFTSQVKTVEKSAFDLTPTSGMATAGDAAMPQPEGNVSALGLGGGENLPTSQSSKMMILPEAMVNYQFIYDGELPFPVESEIGVLKRNPVSVSDKRLTEAVKGFDFGLIDIKKFSDLKMDYLSVSEDKKYGYTLQVNFTEGVINIGQNWPKWPNHYLNCTGDSCQLTEKDMLEDSALIAIADTFVKQHDINLKGYGSPVVVKDWLLYSNAAETMPAYIPDQVRVVYPEMLDGTHVTESDGNFTGVFVTVSVRDKKVSSLNNLKPNSYEKSLYPVEQDRAKLLDWARRGGIFFYAYRGAEKTVEVKLETPELVYFRHFKWVPEENRTDEYVVPAYSFDINADPGLNLFRSKLIVPAVQGFEDLMMDQPEVMPFRAQ